MKKFILKVLLILSKITSYVKIKHNLFKNQKYINNIYKKINYICCNKINKQELYDISILIPMYNSKNTIERCINSIINQKTKYSYEVIVVNDGSTDGSVKLLNKIKTNNVKIINQSNKGIAYTRNVLLENANGKYIAFLDSDDYFNGDFIEKMLSKAIKNKLQYVKCNYTKINQFGKIIKKSEYTSYTNINDLDCYLWGAVIEKEVYRDVSFPEYYWFEDMINGICILPKIKSYGVVEDDLYIYIDYKVSATKIQGKVKNYKNLDQYFLVSEIVRNYNENGIKLNSIQIDKILIELGPMLMSRTRRLPFKIRKAVFVLACNELKQIIKKNNYVEENILIRSILNENFISWNLYCIEEKIKER